MNNELRTTKLQLITYYVVYENDMITTENKSQGNLTRNDVLAIGVLIIILSSLHSMNSYNQ